MPDDSGTNALITQLANPPNPMDYLQKASNALTSMREFQAKQAIADAYRQATDPTTGVVDQNKLTGLISQSPGAFLQGQAMEQGGRGVQAQALGTSASVQASADQMTAVSAYLNPLAKDALQGIPVTADRVNAMLDSIPPGTIPGPMLDNFRRKVNAMPPGANLGDLVLGAQYATTHGLAIIGANRGRAGYANTGAALVPIQPEAGAVPAPLAPLTMTPTPGEQIQMVTIKDSDGVEHQMTAPDAARAVGGQVPGSAPGVVYTPTITPVAPATGGAAQPPAAAPAQQPSTGIPKPTPPPVQRSSAGPQPPPPDQNQPTPPVAQPPASSPPSGQKTSTGATFGTGPQPGQVQTMQASTDAYNALRADMDASNPAGSQQRMFNLQQAQAALAQAKTGPGTETVSQLAGVFGSWAPDFVKNTTGLDVKELATNRDVAQKYLVRIAGAQAGNIGGAVTNDKLAAGFAGSPNVHVQDLAAKDVLQVMQAQEQMRQYLWTQAQSQGVQPKDFANWSAKWATTHDPRAFIVNTLPPKQHAALVDTLIKNGKATPEGVNFANTVTELRKNGAMPGENPQAPE